MTNINELNLSGFRNFYSMSEFVKSVAVTTKVMSWGARGWTKMNDKLLRFRVSANRHKGYIFIAVNGSDLFDIWLTNLKGDIKCNFTDIYLEDVIDIIDEKIEKLKIYNF